MTRRASVLQNPFSVESLDAIFKVRSHDSAAITSRESNTLEFCETFSIGACKNKLRTFAAFANNQGGYFVFGVKDQPRRLVGLIGPAFANLKPHDLTSILNEHFSPEMRWDSYEHEFGGLSFGLIYVHVAQSKPVVCQRNSSEDKCTEATIYYRYRGRTEAIKYPELRALLEELRSRERDMWLKLLRSMATVGVENVGVLDSVTGKVSGAAGSFLIDESLLSKISFIREGHFTEQIGDPTLKLIGDVQAMDSHLVQPTREVVRRTKGINFPDIVTAFLNQEDVPDPEEYIKAACFQTSSTWPVYWFAVKASLSVSDVVKLIDSCKSTSAARARLKDRIIGVAVDKAPPQSTPPTSSTMADYHIRILTKRLPDEPDIVTLKRTLAAIPGLERAEVDKYYLFPKLKAWFDRDYSHLKGSAQGLFRRALAHLDTILYAHRVRGFGQQLG